MIELNRKTVFLLIAMPTTAVLLYWLIRSSRDGKTSAAIEHQWRIQRGFAQAPIWDKIISF